MPPTSTNIRWQAYEHEHFERGKDWFLALGIAAVCIAAISVLFDNILFAVLILLAASTLALLAKTPQTITEFELSDRGIKVNGTMHRFEEIISFWVEDHDADPPTLLIDFTKPGHSAPARTCRF